MNDWTTRYGAWAVVTGASSGLGREFAIQLAQKGVNLILVARRTDLLEQTAKKCEIYNVDSLIITLDLTDRDSIDTLMDKIGDLDIGILVNNAGFGLAGNYMDLNVQKQVKMVQLNCAVPVELTHAILPQMLKKGKGALITVSSLTAFLVNPYFSVYGATKAFDLLFAEALSYELRDMNIDSLILCPGITGTEFLKKSNIRPEFMPVMTPEKVVKKAIQSLGHKLVVIPGIINRLTMFAAGFFPRCLFTPIVAFVLKHISTEDPAHL